MDLWELRNQLDDLARRNAELEQEVARLRQLMAAAASRMEIASYEIKRDMHDDKTNR